MLLKGEFTKHLTAFSIILITALFVLNLGMTLFQYRSEFTAEGAGIRSAHTELLDTYREKPDEYAELYDDFQQRKSEYEAQQYKDMMSADGKSKVIFENLLIDYSGYGDNQLFRELAEIIGKQENYRKSVTMLLRDSALRIQDIDEIDSYLYNYYINLLNIYDPLTGLEIPAAEVRGWNEFFSLQTPVIFLLLVPLALFCQTFTVDSKAGMVPLLHISKNGGRRTVINKLIYTGITSMAVTVVFTLSPLIIFALSTGFSGINMPIQSVGQFTYCRFEITVGQYLLIYTVIRILFFLCFSLAVAVIGQYTGNEAPAFVFAVVITGVGMAMYNISPTSPFYYLQKFSTVAVANVNVLFDRYRGLNIFGNCVDYTAFMLIAAIVLAMLLCAASLLFRQGRALKVEKESSVTGKGHASMSLFGIECYKQLVCESGLMIIIAAVVIKCVISGIYYRPNINSSEQVYMDYISNVSGTITDEKLAYIEQEHDYIQTTLGEYTSKVTAYQNGQLQNDEYREYLNRYNYAKYCEYACDRLVERRDYLLEISGSYDGIEFLYEEGVKRFLEASIDIAAVLAVLFIFSRIFALEYDSGFSKIMRVSKSGRRKIFIVKLFLTLVITIAIYFIFTLIDIAFLIGYYKIDYLSASIMNIPGFSETGLNISILTNIVIYKIISLIGYVVYVLLIISISMLVKNQIKTLILSGMLLFIPFATEYYGINLMRFINVSIYMTPKNIMSGISTYLICSMTALLVLWFARIEWIGRRYLK